MNMGIYFYNNASNDKIYKAHGMMTIKLYIWLLCWNKQIKSLAFSPHFQPMCADRNISPMGNLKNMAPKCDIVVKNLSCLASFIFYLTPNISGVAFNIVLLLPTHFDHLQHNEYPFRFILLSKNCSAPFVLKLP